MLRRSLFLSKVNISPDTFLQIINDSLNRPTMND